MVGRNQLFAAGWGGRGRRLVSLIALTGSLAGSLTGSLTGCGGAEARRDSGYVDHMVFAPPAAADPGEVDADAIERPGDASPKRRTTNRRTATPRRRTADTARLARCAAARDGATRSVGAATAGHLDHGCLMPRRGAGYVRRNAAGWGTEELVGLIQWATRTVARLYRGSVPVVIGALSGRHGGRLRGHRSHQSGRDIDIGYFASDNRALPHFRRMHAGNLDVVKSWSLIGALLSSGQVQYIFMDYELQVLFYRHLEGEGVPETTLRRIFQFPAGRSARRGIIRHAEGHADHIHVRLRCPPHARCR